MFKYEQLPNSTDFLIKLTYINSSMFNVSTSDFVKTEEGNFIRVVKINFDKNTVEKLMQLNDKFFEKSTTLRLSELKDIFPEILNYEERSFIAYQISELSSEYVLTKKFIDRQILKINNAIEKNVKIYNEKIFNNFFTDQFVAKGSEIDERFNIGHLNADAEKARRKMQIARIEKDAYSDMDSLLKHVLAERNFDIFFSKMIIKRIECVLGNLIENGLQSTVYYDHLEYYRHNFEKKLQSFLVQN